MWGGFWRYLRQEKYQGSATSPIVDPDIQYNIIMGSSQYPSDSAVVELPPDTTYLGVIQNALIYRGTEEGTEQDSL